MKTETGEAAETAAPNLRTGDRQPPSQRTYPLGMVLQACPDIVDYGKGGEISCWRDLIDAAAIVRSALGVSPDAWAQALDAMGEHDASIVIAAILQRGEDIKSAGGYLRVLTTKAREGAFSLGPVLMALLRGKVAKAARERKRVGLCSWRKFRGNDRSGRTRSLGDIATPLLQAPLPDQSLHRLRHVVESYVAQPPFAADPSPFGNQTPAPE
jgi:hypothetical protein